MMRQYELVERVLSYDPKADEALLNRAYVYAMRAHGTQKRADGAPYFSPFYLKPGTWCYSPNSHIGISKRTVNARNRT